jgi:hypothetical protein
MVDRLVVLGVVLFLAFEWTVILMLGYLLYVTL